MKDYDLIYPYMRTHRWALFFLTLALISAMPLLLIVGSPMLHAAGLHDLASAGDNMIAATDGQEAAMAGLGAGAAAGAAAAGGSGSEDRDFYTGRRDGAPRNTDLDSGNLLRGENAMDRWWQKTTNTEHTPIDRSEDDQATRG